VEFLLAEVLEDFDTRLAVDISINASIGDAFMRKGHSSNIQSCFPKREDDTSKIGIRIIQTMLEGRLYAYLWVLGGTLLKSSTKACILVGNW
jgi:hypothetical protein